MPRKDLLDIASLGREEIDLLLDQAIPFKELFTRSVKKVPALKGKSVLTLFYEPSTRTHSSFEVAAKRLSADVTNFDVRHSSVTKGESVRETVETLQAMRTDYIIVRHSRSGLPAAIAAQTKASVVNAGDGAHAHPTQALLDAFTIKEKFPDPTGKKVLIKINCNRPDDQLIKTHPDAVRGILDVITPMYDGKDPIMVGESTAFNVPTDENYKHYGYSDWNNNDSVNTS